MFPHLIKHSTLLAPNSENSVNTHRNTHTHTHTHTHQHTPKHTYTQTTDLSLTDSKTIIVRGRGHSKYVRSFFDRSCFYEMKPVINFMRLGGPAPHTRQAGAAPQTLRFCSVYKAKWVNKPVYKFKNKSRDNFS